MTSEAAGGEEEKRDSLDLLTESRSSTARRCAREQHLRYDLGFVPVAALAEPLRFGTLGHLGLETWWSLMGSGELEHTRLDAAIGSLRRHGAPEVADPFELVRLEELLRGYDARWGNDRYEVLGVEMEFRGPLINPETGGRSRTFERAGKVDVLVADQGRKLIVEHKFSGEDITPGSAFWARLRMGGQAAGYIRGLEFVGYSDVVGVLYDVIAKPRLRPLRATPEAERKYTKAKGDEPSRLYANQREFDETAEEYRMRVREHIAEDPDHYYQRGLVVRLEDQMVEHDREAWILAAHIRENRRLGIHPRNPDACQRYGSLCAYYGVCCGEASLDDPSLFKHIEWVHPELTPVVDPAVFKRFTWPEEAIK